MNTYARKALKAARLSFSPLYRRALLKGVGAAIEHESILRLLAAEGIDAVIDIGANVGQFALATRRCIPQARITSFEPLAIPAEKYRSVFAGDSKTTLHQGAVGPKTDVVEMHVSASNDSSSLLPISREQTSIFPGTHEVRTERVHVAPLDTYLPNAPDDVRTLLKIDVQGYELDALRGCEPFLDSFHVVYVECSFIELYENQSLADSVIDFLQHRGFFLAGIHGLTYDAKGQSVQADFLFRHRRS